MYITTEKAAIETWKRLVGDDEVLLMVSGGVDSMALMETARLAGIHFSVMHVTHDMRPEAETDADSFIVSSYCDKYNIPFVQRYSNSQTKSETDYRNQRIQHIVSHRRRNHFKYVATGHHADDQIETVLMRILRGCGIEGLSGIKMVSQFPSKNVNLTYVRPFLNIPKAKLVELCRARGVAFHEDYTNQDNTILRNSIRNTVVPQLREINPMAHVAISRLACTAEEASEYVNRNVDRYIQDRCLVNSKDDLEFDRSSLIGEGDYFLHHFFKKLYTIKMGSVGLDKLNRNRMIEFIKVVKSDSSNNKTVELNGCKFYITKNTVKLV